MVETDLTARLKALDTCSMSDALDQLGLPAAVTGIGPRTVMQRIAGKVITVKLARHDPERRSTRHLCTTAIEAAGPGDIIVVEQRTGADCAGWGGILSNAAHVKGLAGVIVEGPARDIDEARDLGFNVYARSTTSRTARGRVQEVSTGEPIQVGEVTVASGDYVLADGSGVVFLAAADAARILDAAEAIARREAAMTSAVRAGKPVGAVMGGDYEDMLKAPA